MSDYFSTLGRTLISHGYLVIPIKPGHKRPALGSWQTARLGAADLARYPDHGVGVLCGQGAQPIAAIDVDTTDAALAQAFLSWCYEHLGVTCERVGKAPKVLLVYRAASDGWGKATGAWFAHEWKAGPNGKLYAGGVLTDVCGDPELDAEGKYQNAEPVHRIEVLGHGQQFVAYHIHPDTGRPYEWVDLLGGISEMEARELPVITEQQVAAALAEFERLALLHGFKTKPGSVSKAGNKTAAADLNDPLMTYEPPIGLPLADAKRLLAHVDNEDYETWLRAGMALHHEYEGSDDALTIWDDWSSSASNYRSREDLEFRWSSFGRGTGRTVTVRWLIKLGNANEREAERAEKRSSLSEVRAVIAACTDSIVLVNEVARRAGDAAGDDIALKAELAGLLRAKFKELTETALSAAEVRTAMAGGRKVIASRARAQRPRTEFGNAERMLDHNADGLMYVAELDAWYSWTGVYWRRAAGVELEHLAKETIRRLPDEIKEIESDEERAEFFKFCAASQKAHMVGNMISLAKSDPRVVVPVEELDKQHHLFGVANGVVDLRTGKLLQPQQSYRITTITDVEYDASAVAPLWDQTVSDVFFGDADMIAFFQRLVGYALMGSPDEDVLVIPYGGGSNGKSTVLGTVRQVLGGYSKTASAETFLSSQKGAGGAGGGQAREDVLRLRGARFVYVGEPEENSELREGLIKSMTGGDPMPARGLYAKTTVEVVPSWVAFMPTNHKPIIRGDDVAIWRRLLPVPFLRNFEADKAIVKDEQRPQKLRAEFPGILRWCIEGALAYQQCGLCPPAAVRAAREEYKADMDLLADWLIECCELDPNCATPMASLWASWEHFAKARGELQLIRSSRALSRRLATRFSLRVGHAGFREILGLKLKATCEL